MSAMGHLETRKDEEGKLTQPCTWATSRAGKGVPGGEQSEQRCEAGAQHLEPQDGQAGPGSRSG